MIEIRHINLDKIINNHLMAIKNECLCRIKFCTSFLDALIARTNISDEVINIKKSDNIAFQTTKSFINKYFNGTVKIKCVDSNFMIKNIQSNSKTLEIKPARKEEFKNVLLSLNWVKDNLDKILISPPEDLLRLNGEFEDKCCLKYKVNVTIVLQFILPYEKLTQKGFKFNGSIWSNYTFTDALGLQTCPYCNRSWISTVRNGARKLNVINPQLDHFFSQNRYPLLRLSFFNLVPSCEPCNSRLKQNTILDDSFLNPYIEGYNEDGKFFAVAKDVLSCLGLDSNYKVGLKTPNEIKNRKKADKIKRNHKLFEIDKIYENHGDIIADIYRKNYLYSNNYISFLKTQFPSLNEDVAELYRFAFSNYYMDSDFMKRPLAKLIKDITQELGLLDRIRPS